MIFISAPEVDFDFNGNLISLSAAATWSTPRLTLPSGTFRVTTTNSISAPFTTGGSNLTIGGTVPGNAARTFLFAPADNFTGSDLTSLTGCVLSQALNVTGLLGNTSYRAMVLAQASAPFLTERDWIVIDTTVLAAPGNSGVGLTITGTTVGAAA